MGGLGATLLSLLAPFAGPSSTPAAPVSPESARVAPASRRRSADEAWEGVWLAFLRLRGSGGAPAAAAAVAGEARALGDAHRLDLLDALSGEAPAGERLGKWLRAESEWPLDALESWLAAEVLGPGALRGQAVREALADPEQLSPEHLQLAYEASVEAAEDLRLVEAIDIQENLHGRNRAEWSALNLVVSLRRMGDYDAAERILAEQLEREVTPGLLSQRGLNALARHEETRARRFLGAALARGSQDAAVMLGRLDLAQGRLDEAERAFAALVADDPGAWALRGWGLTLVEEPLRERSSGAAAAPQGVAMGGPRTEGTPGRESSPAPSPDRASPSVP